MNKDIYYRTFLVYIIKYCFADIIEEGIYRGRTGEHRLRKGAFALNGLPLYGSRAPFRIGFLISEQRLSDTDIEEGDQRAHEKGGDDRADAYRTEYLRDTLAG